MSEQKSYKPAPQSEEAACDRTDPVGPNSDKVASLADTYSQADAFDYLLMTVGTLGALVTGFSLPFFNYLFGELMDDLNGDPAQYKRRINTLCITLVVAAGINMLSGFLQVYCWNRTGERQSQKLRVAYVRAVLSQEIGWFDMNEASTLATKVSDLMGKIGDGMGRKTGDVIQFTSQITSAFIVSLYMDWKIALVVLAGVPLIGAAGTYMINVITASQNQALEQYASAGGVATQSFTAIRTITALNLQPYFLSQYRKYLIDALDVGILKGLKVGLGNGLMFGVYYLVYALGFWYGGQLVATSVEDECTRNCTTGGIVVSVFFSITMGAEALGQIAPPLTANTAARSAIVKVLEIIRRKPKIESKQLKETQPQGTKLGGQISFENVGFAYPSRPDVKVCESLSLSINAGETVALVGSSGSGKSTVVNMLLRFYDPISGQVMIDGRNVRSFNLDWLRNQIGYVGQEPVLFNGSIAENIAFGLGISNISNYTSEEREEIMTKVARAAKLANAHDFITSFPQGYETDVGSNGGALSGGQKQRIAIARALIKQPSILLLDEATSALDAQSERVVQESIDALSSRKADGLADQKITIVIVAHRLSTIRNADRIFVLERGNVVEQGTHDHLMTLEQRYADLVRLQATEKTSDNGVSAPSSPSKGAVSSSLVAKTDLSEERTSISRASYQSVATTEKSDKQEEDTKESDSNTTRRIRSMILDHAGFLLIGLSGAAIFGGVFPAWGYMIAKAVSSFYLPDPDEIREEAAFNAYIFILLSGVSFFSAIAQYYGIVGLGERISCRFRSDLFQALLRNHIGFFDHPDNSIGSLTSMLAEDTRLLHKAFGESLAKQIMAVSTLVVGLVIAFIASWKISLVVLATFPLNIIASGIQMQAWQGQQYDDSADDSKESATANNGSSDAVADDNKAADAKSRETTIAAAKPQSASSPGALISTAFTNIRTIHAFSMQDYVVDKYADITLERSKAREQKGVYGGLGFGGSNFVIFSIYALLFWYGSQLLKDEEITFEEMLIAMLTLMLGALGLGHALADLSDQTTAVQAAKRMFKIIDSSVDQSANPIDGFSEEGVTLPSGAEQGAAVALEHLTFRYPTRKEIKVWQDFSLAINSGEVIAFIGPSGCGKSTIINLLLRFYDAEAGNIMYNGEAISNLNVRWLRSQIGYVGQEPVLFSGTIEENILFGLHPKHNLLSLEDAITIRREERAAEAAPGTIRGASSSLKVAAGSDIEAGTMPVQAESKAIDPRVRRAAIAANAHDFITAFPDGYHTVLGEKSGIALSGGQKQRIAIARALIKQPSILLLDEATSALDAQSERVVQESIDALAANLAYGDNDRSRKTTIIMIAHRLSTVRNADRICVFDQGKLVEMGSHEELMNASPDNGGVGLYRKLYESQNISSGSAQH